MNPVTIVTKVAVATGRRLSSSYAKSSGSSSSSSSSTIGRVVGSVGTVPTSSLQQKQTTDTTGTLSSPLNRLIRQVAAPGAAAAAAAQRRTKSALAAVDIEHETATATYDQSIREPFPSIVIGPERSIEPQGSFAEAQAQVRHNDNDIEKKMMVYTDHTIFT